MTIKTSQPTTTQILGVEVEVIQKYKKSYHHTNFHFFKLSSYFYLVCLFVVVFQIKNNFFEMLFDTIHLLIFCIVFPYYYKLRTRSYDLERQDKTPEEGNFTINEFEDMMKGLADLNRIDKGGYEATLRLFDKLDFTPVSIMEIGFGRGDFSIMLAKKYPNTTIVGFDAHYLSVNAAKSNLENYTSNYGSLSNVRFELCPVNEMIQTENSYDIITTTLVNHHIFPDEEFINFLKYIRKVGRKAFIFNDVYRSFPIYFMSLCFLNFIRDDTRANYTRSFFQYLYDNIYPLEVFKISYEMIDVISNRPGSSLLIDGGIKSIEKSFKYSELVEMLKLAGYPDNSLECDFSYIPGRISCYVSLEK